MHRARSFLFLAVLLAGCAAPSPAAPTPPAVGPDEPVPLGFDGERALLEVRKQVLYPNGTVRTRIPGTEGSHETARGIAATLESLGWTVRWHHFNATYGCRTTPMHNVEATRPGSGNRTLILGAHFDTRPLADKEARPEDRDRPIPGANDGASGVAVLLELARALGNETPADTLRFVFFDGEDGGGFKGNLCTAWILGSTAYAAEMTEADVASTRGMILVDLVGDPGLTLPWEMFSRNPPQYFPPGARDSARLQDAIWATAKTVNASAFVERPAIYVNDDHLPFLQRGIPAVDIIDLRPAGLDGDAFPPTHHRLTDDVEHVSGESLAQVGRTLERYLRAN